MKSTLKSIFAFVLRKVRFLLVAPFALALVILVRILRPVKLIRFGESTSSRIGHFAANIELYLCERDSGIQDKNAFDIFYHKKPICNSQLQKMWQRNPALRFWSFAYWLNRLNRMLPGGSRHAVPMPTDRDIHNFYMKFPPHLGFTEEEERFGQAQLLNMGVPAGEPFVCFHVRNPDYLNQALSYGQWDYHNFRDSDIGACLSASEELARRGNYMIRMGAVVPAALDWHNQKIIDYATKFRTDFLDIYLSARCRFFICSCTGIGVVTMTFRRPVAWINFVPLEYMVSWNEQDLIIPKKLWLRREKRFMGFREILESGVGRFLDSRQYQERGIEVVDNTAEEIRDVATEMEERLSGTWQEQPGDEELQRHFRGLFSAPDLHGKVLVRAGAAFLRQNRQFLD